MPKIIENLEEKLLTEARKQVESAGYSGVTIRSVAKACGVGVGTVYNYFPSKDALLAAFMLEDWKVSIGTIGKTAVASDSPLPVLRVVYDELQRYAALHKGILQDEGAASVFAASFGRYHALLRHQLAVPLQKFCADPFTADFIAESLLTWTMAGKSFDDLQGILQKLF